MLFFKFFLLAFLCTLKTILFCSDKLVDFSVSKGDKIYVEGRLKTRKWQDQDNNDRYTTEINVDEFTFLSTKKNELDGVQHSITSPPKGADNSAEDDLPF